MHAIYSYFKRSGTSNSVAIHNNITVFIVVWYLHVQPSSYTHSYPTVGTAGIELDEASLEKRYSYTTVINSID